MKVLSGALAVCGAAAIGGPALAQPAAPASPYFVMKMPVTDFARSEAYYARFFPLKRDRLYNDHELGLAWIGAPTEARLVLYLDTCGKPTPTLAERQAEAAKATTQLQKQMRLCEHPFRAGSGFVVIRVKDVRGAAAALTAAGYEARVRDPTPGVRAGLELFLTKDPDGNIVEVVSGG